MKIDYVQFLILCIPYLPLKLNVGNCWHVYVGVTTKELGLTYVINSKEISKPTHEVLLEEQELQRKASFLFCTIWPNDLFLLMVDSLSISISNINWIYWIRWFLRWQMEEFGTTWITLAKVVLSFQPWNQHRRFVLNFHIVVLGKCLAWIKWMCGMWKQTKILTS